MFTTFRNIWQQLPENLRQKPEIRQAEEQIIQLLSGSEYTIERNTLATFLLESSIADLIIEFDTHLKFLDAYTFRKELLFADIDIGRHKTPTEMFGEDGRFFEGKMREVIETGSAVTFEYPSLDSLKWFTATLSPLKSADGGELLWGIVREITDHKLMEDNLAKSEERYQMAVQGSSAGIWDWADINQDTQWWSESYYHLLGFLPGEIEPSFSSFSKLIHPDDADAVTKAINIHTRDKSSYSIEYRLRCKNGEYKWVMGSGQALDHHNKTAMRMVGTIIDITERKEAEQQLIESELRYELAIKGTSAGIWDWLDIKEERLWWSDKFYELIGYMPGEVKPSLQLFTNLIYPDDLDQVKDMAKLHFEQDKPFMVEYRIKHKTEGYKWVVSTGKAYRDSKGNPVRMVGSIVDIHSRKTTEQKLKENEERFRVLIESASDIFYTTDQRGHFTYVNDFGCSLVGYTSEQLLGMHYLDVINPEYRDMAKYFYQRQVTSNKPVTYYEIEIVSSSGKKLWVGQNVQLLYRSGKYAGMQAIARDITPIKELQHSLVASEDKFKKLLKYSYDVTTVLSADGLVKYQSESFARVFGAEENIVGKSIFEYIHPDDVAMVAEEIKKGVERGGVSDFIEHRFLKADGSWLNVESIGNNLLNEPAIEGIVVNTRDITERKQAQLDLLKAKDEAEAAARAKTEFLSNMSHEIRTPMNAIIGITDLMLDKEMDKEAKQFLKSVKHSADNLLVIINDILDFAKIDSGKLSFERIPFNLHVLLGEVKNTFNHKAVEKGISLTLTFNNTLPETLRGDPYRLNQILLNLISNAIKFTDQGSVDIKVEVIRSDSHLCRLLITISDTGIGIPVHKQQAIFESFTQAYTDVTRKFGGTGLGLAITKNLVQLQGGSIMLKSELNKGSSFFVELPYEHVDIAELNTEKVLEQKEKDLTGFHILVAEDNQMNQFVIKQILSKWNASFIIVENGIEAIRELEEQYYDLVMMDLQMPEMSGYGATSAIRAKNSGVLNPSVPIIAITADAFIDTKLKVFESGMNDFITKPIDKDELYAKIIKHARP